MQTGAIQSQMRGLSASKREARSKNQIPHQSRKGKKTKLTGDGVRDGVGGDRGADRNQALHALGAHELVVRFLGRDDGDGDRDGDSGGRLNGVYEKVGVQTRRDDGAPVAAARGSGDAAGHAPAARLLERWPEGTAREGGLHRK